MLIYFNKVFIYIVYEVDENFPEIHQRRQMRKLTKGIMITHIMHCATGAHVVPLPQPRIDPAITPTIGATAMQVVGFELAIIAATRDPVELAVAMLVSLVELALKHIGNPYTIPHPRKCNNCRNWNGGVYGWWCKWIWCIWLCSIAGKILLENSKGAACGRAFAGFHIDLPTMPQSHVHQFHIHHHPHTPPLQCLQ